MEEQTNVKKNSKNEFNNVKKDFTEIKTKFNGIESDYKSIDKRFDDFKFYLKLIFGGAAGVLTIFLGANIYSIMAFSSIKKDAIEEATKGAKEAIQQIETESIKQIKSVESEAVKTTKDRVDSLISSANKRFDNILNEIKNRGDEAINSIRAYYKAQMEKEMKRLVQSSNETSGNIPINEIQKIPDENVARALAEKLEEKGKLTDQDIVETFNTAEIDSIKRQLQSDNYNIRSSAAKFLGTYKDKEFALKLLIQRLKIETDWLVRLSIVESLGKIGGEEAKAALLKVKEEQYGFERGIVKSAAENALKNPKIK